MKPSTPTHIAYSDESHHNTGRFRSVALVSLATARRDRTTRAVAAVLNRHGIGELKYKNLKDGRQARAAGDVVELVCDMANDRNLRVDVLAWDVEDSRHAVQGRDDVANLGRMNHHLYRVVLRQRWPDAARWLLCPDQHDAIDWSEFEHHLEWKAQIEQENLPLAPHANWYDSLRIAYNIDEVRPVDSKKEPLCQVADLFAGIAVKSRLDFDNYMRWYSATPRSPGLFDPTPPRVSANNLNRYRVIRRLRRRCHELKLGVGLRNAGALKTHDGANPMNFWWWEPQHPADRAPTRSQRA